MDDIIIKHALGENEKMYYISGEFSLNILLAKEAEFSNASGWTLEQYLDIEKNLPDSIPTIYNFTREQFIWDLITPYIYQSID